MATVGYRDDSGKPLYHLLPSDALDGVVRVLTHGATKYAERNWERGMAWSRCYNSLMRHAWKWWRGEDMDADSGLPHVDHIVCNALFLAAYWRREHLRSYDDREPSAHAEIQRAGVLEPLAPCSSCAGRDGYHRTPCALFEVAAR